MQRAKQLMSQGTDPHGARKLLLKYPGEEATALLAEVEVWLSESTVAADVAMAQLLAEEESANAKPTVRKQKGKSKLFQPKSKHQPKQIPAKQQPEPVVTLECCVCLTEQPLLFSTSCSRCSVCVCVRCIQRCDACPQCQLPGDKVKANRNSGYLAVPKVTTERQEKKREHVTQPDASASTFIRDASASTLTRDASASTFTVAIAEGEAGHSDCASPKLSALFQQTRSAFVQFRVAIESDVKALHVLKNRMLDASETTGLVLHGIHDHASPICVWNSYQELSAMWQSDATWHHEHLESYQPGADLFFTMKTPHAFISVALEGNRSLQNSKAHELFCTYQHMCMEYRLIRSQEAIDLNPNLLRQMKLASVEHPDGTISSLSFDPGAPDSCLTQHRQNGCTARRFDTLDEHDDIDFAREAKEIGLIDTMVAQRTDCVAKRNERFIRDPGSAKS
jgi:hypothetical protein